MTALIRTATMAIALGTSTFAVAGELGSERPQRLAEACYARPLLTGCPDDYCRKPMPRVMCLPCGQPYDYCRKSLPRIWPSPCGEPDDYCRTPWPHVCRPLRPEYYNCGQRAH